jgi:predicted DNA-binding transcriptional regulator YafY
MLETSARLLRLLSLLQAHRDWTGTELADRLSVTTRTIRSDIEKLRNLGYPVAATPGVAGGYRLGAGAQLPPLLLDDDDAVAVALGLRIAAGGSVAGLEEASLRALTKLEQMLPSRLRERVNTLQEFTLSLPSSRATVDSDVLVGIAVACRNHERLRFDYRDHGGDLTRRDVEPHRLVHGGGRWYLVAWDTDRADWRTFRVDRVTPKIPTGPRFQPRPEPDDEVAMRVAKGVATATWQFRARIRCAAPAAVVSSRLPRGVSVEPDGDAACIVSVGSDSMQMLAGYIAMLDVDFEVLDSPELTAHLDHLAERFVRAGEDRHSMGR